MCIAGKGLFRAAEVGEFGGVNAGETDVYLHQSVINIKISILQNMEQGTKRKKHTVLSLNSLFSVGTFFHGNHPHPVNFPPGV